jgi:hypothetical protein
MKAFKVLKGQSREIIFYRVALSICSFFGAANGFYSIFKFSLRYFTLKVIKLCIVLN